MQQDSDTPQPVTPHEYPAPTFTEPKPAQRGSWYSALSTILILIAAPLVALLLTAFVFQSYEVDGPSMETTLQNRDRLIVLKVPRTVARITGNSYVPNRNDIIVFVKRGLQEFGDNKSDKQLIKRVIGVPGDRVVVKDGSIAIFNTENPSGFNPDVNTQHGERVNNTPGNVDVIVKPGEVFVSGDNRTNSLDSRHFGAVPSSDIVGKLLFRVFPLNNAESF